MKINLFIIFRLCIALFCFIFLFHTANAAIIVVNASNNDIVGCSLVDAINSANANATEPDCIASLLDDNYGDDEIYLPSNIEYFDVGVQQGNWNGLPHITSNIKIIGLGPTMANIRHDPVSSENLRFFQIIDGGMLTLENVKLSGGNPPSNFSALGGAILVTEGKLQLHNCEVSNNQSSGGGGIAVYGGNSSAIIQNTLIINNRAFEVDNGAGGGGGVYAAVSANLSIFDSTISNNIAETTGGGVGMFEFEIGTYLYINNTTISGNNAREGGGVGISSHNGSGRVNILNSLIAGNESTGVGLKSHELARVGPSVITMDFHNNLIGFNGISSDEAVRNISVSTENENIFSTSDGDIPRPLEKIILPLADNGGATMTHALPPRSPAIDKATDGFYTGTFPLLFWNSGCRDASSILGPPGDYRPDQRGVNRPIGGACDIGAYESEVTDDYCHVIKARNNKIIHFCL